MNVTVLENYEIPYEVKFCSRSEMLIYDLTYKHEQVVMSPPVIHKPRAQQF